MTTQQDRVEQNTPDSLNDEIELQLRDNIRKYATADKSTLSQRIAELEKEWYMDRMLITNASSIAGIGVLLAATVHKKMAYLAGSCSYFSVAAWSAGLVSPTSAVPKAGSSFFQRN